jgi:hypothetical protein
MSYNSACCLILLGLLLDLSSNPEDVASSSSETSMGFYSCTWYYMEGDITLHRLCLLLLLASFLLCLPFYPEDGGSRFFQYRNTLHYIPERHILHMLWLPHACCLFLAGLTLSPWKWRQHIPLKCQGNSIRLHNITSQKIVLFQDLFCVFPAGHSWVLPRKPAYGL